MLQHETIFKHIGEYTLHEKVCSKCGDHFFSSDTTSSPICPYCQRKEEYERLKKEGEKYR